MSTKKEPGITTPRLPNLKVHHEECCTPNITALSRGCQEISEPEWDPIEVAHHGTKGMKYEV